MIMKSMKAVIVVLLFCLAAAPARAQKTVSVDLANLLSTLSYNYDGGSFAGDFNFNVIGLAPGDVTIVLENAAGEKVLDRTLPCQESYSGESEQACYISSYETPEATPYAVQSGTHTLKLMSNGKTVYEFVYDITVKKENDYTNVYVSGDWSKLAAIDFSAEPGLTVTVPLGGPDQCGGPYEDVQVQLLRDGELVGRGHTEGYFYPSCSTANSNFMLFYTDAENLTTWVPGKKLIFREGQYELKLFRNRVLDKTFAFTLTEGNISSTPPAGLQAGLLPDRVNASDQVFVIYQK
jgi:hypothetical protein